MKLPSSSELRSQAPWLALSAGLGAATAIVLARNFLETGRKIRERITTDYGVSDPRFARTMSQLMGPPLVDGNRVTPLKNGVEIYPAMFEAVGSAKHSITFENFIWHEGDISRRFATILADQARAGVKVHVLQDAFGCDHLHGESMNILRRAPVQLEIFRFMRFTRFNMRTHRKLLVVDGRVGFMGGVAISDRWDGDADEPDHWRDMQYRVEGPVVGQIQRAFMDNWMQTHAGVLHGDDYFPELSAVGNIRCHAFKSSANEGADGARVMLLLSIAAARKSIRIANAYFIPDDLIIETLLDARARGVEVEIIVPGEHIDRQIVRVVSRSRWKPLLEAGVRIYEFQPCRFHCKYLIVDDCWVSVGSANMDNRSLRLNNEANLNILDGDFAKDHVRIFEADKSCSVEITMDDWRHRPVAEKLAGQTVSLVRSQL